MKYKQSETFKIIIMKNLIFTIVLAFIAKFSFGQSHVHVRRYVTKNGTYVQPHHRTSPNNTVFDNWSTYPNVNPYTGNVGSKVFINVSTSIPTNTFRNEINRPSPIFKTNEVFRQNDLFKPNRLFN